MADWYRNGRHGLDRARQLREVIAHCQRAIEIDGELAKAYALLGLVHQEQGDVEKAREFCGEARRIDPDDFDVRRWELSVIFRRDDLEEASAFLDGVCADRDLNGDGDTDDSVFHVHDLFTGETTNWD